jgi:hypothetical protein
VLANCVRLKLPGNRAIDCPCRPNASTRLSRTLSEPSRAENPNSPAIYFAALAGSILPSPEITNNGDKKTKMAALAYLGSRGLYYFDHHHFTHTQEGF